MTAFTRPWLETPDALVEQGSFHYGTFRQPFRRINPLDADVFPRLIRNMRLKEWQHFALVNDDIYISLALFNAKLLALAQVCVYDRRRGEPLFYERKVLPGAMKLPSELWDDRASYRGRGFVVEIHNHLNEGAHHISFSIAATKTLPAVKGQFTCFEPLEKNEPMIVCLPLGKGRALYSHKCIATAKGTLRVGDEEVSFAPGDAYGLVDIHKGYYPYVMKWYWATAGGYRDDGTLLGFNLTNNQVRDQRAYNENGLWVDGKLHLLPPVRFEGVSTKVSETWQINDEEGRVSLTFQPEVFRFVDVQALVLRSRYRGPYGTFSGWIKDDEGRTHEIEQFFGMCEDFYLRV